MTTGQYPKRRETDEQAKRRVERLEQRKKDFESQAKPAALPFLESWKIRLSAAGRLTRS